MASQNIFVLDNTLSVLLESSTSPEKALQLFSTSFFTPEAYSKENYEPVVIFLAYMGFMMNRQPSGSVLSVEGIWEEILKKAFMYLRMDNCYINYYIHQYRDNHPPDICAWLVPALRDKIGAWVIKILGHHDRCSNPYVRLDIFRLTLKLGHSRLADQGEDCESLCKTFWYTICEVNPHRFYPSGDGYDPMFDATDMMRMLRNVSDYTYNDYINDLNFLSKVIQLSGVFATKIKDDLVRYEDLHSCISTINSLWDMSDQVTCQSIRPYVLETLREITATAIFSKGRETAHVDYRGREISQVDFGIFKRRDSLVKGIDFSPKPLNLPRLLLLRQVQGPWQVCQQAMLLKDLDPIFNNVTE